MSKCKPTKTDTMVSLEPLGVTLTDITEVSRDTKALEDTKRKVIISIPYEALRDDKNVQLAFQDLVTISTE